MAQPGGDGLKVDPRFIAAVIFGVIACASMVAVGYMAAWGACPYASEIESRVRNR